MVVTRVVNVSWYYVRLTHHEYQGCTLRLDEEYTDMLVKMTIWFSDHQARMKSGKLQCKVFRVTCIG